MIKNRLTLFTKNQIYSIHLASLNVLEEIGILMDDETVLNFMEKMGANVNYKTKIVKIPHELVLEALKKTPKSIKLYGRNLNEITLSKNDVYNGSGNNAVAVLDFDGNRRPATFKDLEDFTRLQDGLDNVHIMSTPITRFLDFPLRGIYKKSYEGVVKNTEKHVINQADGKKELLDEIRMASVILDIDIEDIGKKPIFSIIADMASPLKYPKHVLEVIVESAKFKIPILIESDPHAGGTAPITASGLLIQQNAEILAGITLTQLINPRTPVIYTTAPTVLDMKTGLVSLGAPERSIYVTASAQLANYYNIPFCTVMGTTDSKIVDIQSGYEKAISFLIAALAGSNIITAHTGMLESCLTISYEQSIIDNEIYGMVFRILKSSEVSEKTLLESLEVIKNVGPLGSNYLGQKHTREYFNKEIWLPIVSERNKWETWIKKGKRSTLELAKEKAKKILEDHHPEPLPKETIEKIIEIVKEPI
ncbi:MAG: trimethylamine methyltransferase family protein [Candidatus Bathyarchaeia archaeon]|nr:trimethylamine methyltransferase family protein [Candidatus Bathyarchaeota archaeon]